MASTIARCTKRTDRFGAFQNSDPRPQLWVRFAEFARFFRDVVNDETVPDGIPYAVPWDQLEKKRKISAKVKSIRVKLNVPLERFHITADGRYRWAGKT